jgi:hypothetical protein
VIHYHGTPIGGTRQGAARFLLGRHALVSFAYPQDIETVAEVCASYVLDNGAFTTWKQGRPLDVNGYLQWAWQWGRLPGCDWCLIPDVIDGNEAENDRLIEEWPHGLRGCPVWHLHESLDRLAKLCEEWPVVAFGSSGEWPDPGTEGWHRRMAAAMEVACDAEGVPRCRLHGLRMLNPAIFSGYPLSSADSTNAGQNGSREARRLNTECCVGATVIATRIEMHNSAQRFRRQERRWVSMQLFGDSTEGAAP